VARGGRGAPRDVVAPNSLVVRARKVVGGAGLEPATQPCKARLAPFTDEALRLCCHSRLPSHADRSANDWIVRIARCELPAQSLEVGKDRRLSHAAALKRVRDAFAASNGTVIFRIRAAGTSFAVRVSAQNFLAP